MLLILASRGTCYLTKTKL